MAYKLTLKLDEDIVGKAKSYAKEHNSSVSKLVEEYFRFLTSGNSDQLLKITPTVKKLSGILNNIKHIDPKVERAEYLSKKHSS